MSVTVLKLIPTTATYIPDEEKQKKAVALLRTIYPRNEIAASVTERVEFIDPGSNFESISCNKCNSTIEIEAWHELMDKAWQNNFSDLMITTPCCNNASSLNELTYQFPAGFSMFTLVIFAPSEKIRSADFQRLQNELNSPLKEIWAHY
ncbi:hypothetical protein [Sediminibacterium ginsengisoli]|uniref:Uncharacterized protein n=1 Tax=Sediminibacterium ginsengisoli TaxID=413434 RepID=A0A1T4QZV0_9BACT|nr:hypothetical protein [Sediminibacterium ginsengisoli]SKA09342.1 hypothetical protein SAMN04488132_11029 [Sediminibacterium ginsengisoli]